MAKKDAYYFSHDSNARQDPKCAALINDYGPEGYGIFWMLVEIMSEQENYKIKKFPKLYEGLAKQMGSNASLLRSITEAMLHDYELLLEDECYIWSNSLLRRMDEKEKKRTAKAEAGRIGGINSGKARNDLKQNEAVLEINEAVLQTFEANEAKESKVNESKVNENKKIMCLHTGIVEKMGCGEERPKSEMSGYFLKTANRELTLKEYEIMSNISQYKDQIVKIDKDAANQ